MAFDYFTPRIGLSELSLSIAEPTMKFFDILVMFLYPLLILALLIFKPKIPPKASIEGNGWTRTDLKTRGYTVANYYKLQEKPAKLVFLLHGWHSSSLAMKERAEHLYNLGYHVWLMEMPGHGQSEKHHFWTAGWVSLHANTAIRKALEMTNNKTCLYYGHSLGGFVGIKLSSWDQTKELIDSVILESPMTKYTIIIRDMPIVRQLPKPILRVLEEIICALFWLTHLNLGPISMKDVDVPNWGLPSQPTLIVQAETDNRLGRDHYDALVHELEQQEESDYVAHLISSLTHSGARENPDRENHIVSWLASRGQIEYEFNHSS